LPRLLDLAAVSSFNRRRWTNFFDSDMLSVLFFQILVVTRDSLSLTKRAKQKMRVPFQVRVYYTAPLSFYNWTWVEENVSPH
jgi:hypothetical protein